MTYVYKTVKIYNMLVIMNKIHALQPLYQHSTVYVVDGIYMQLVLHACFFFRSDISVTFFTKTFQSFVPLVVLKLDATVFSSLYFQTL